MKFIMSINPTAFGPIMDRSEGAARVFVLYNTSPQSECLYEFGPGAGGVMRYKY